MLFYSVDNSDSELVKFIRTNYIYLLDRINTRYSLLLDHPLDRDVLGGAEMEDINAETTLTGRNMKLLSILCRKPNKHFDAFIEALKATGQQHIAGGRQIHFHVLAEQTGTII
jgi:Caspase recruitment domain